MPGIHPSNLKWYVFVGPEWEIEKDHHLVAAFAHELDAQIWRDRATEQMPKHHRAKVVNRYAYQSDNRRRLR